jgi:hypothetical protein
MKLSITLALTLLFSVLTQNSMAEDSPSAQKPLTSTQIAFRAIVYDKCINTKELNLSGVINGLASDLPLEMLHEKTCTCASNMIVKDQLMVGVLNRAAKEDTSNKTDELILKERLLSSIFICTGLVVDKITDNYLADKTSKE